MIIMKSKLVIIVLVVIIIIVIATVVLLNRNNSTRNQGSYETGNTGYYGNDGYVPVIPENYIQIAPEMVTSETDEVAEAVAYYYDGNETKVNVYLQNRGTEPISKSAVCQIELYDVDNRLYRFGGVFENGVDIKPGDRSVIRTQFVEKTKDIVSAVIRLEFPKSNDTQEESIETEISTEVVE